MKEALINHNCQMLLPLFFSNHAVPEETQLCVVTKLHILWLALCLPLSRSLFSRGRARTHARILGGRGRMSSHFMHKESAHWSIVPRYINPPSPSSLISKKDADLPKEYMSPKKISIIQQGRRAPKPKPVVKPLIMLLILRKKKITTFFQPFFSLTPPPPCPSCTVI